MSDQQLGSARAELLVISGGVCQVGSGDRAMRTAHIGPYLGGCKLGELSAEMISR
jgi:hypothetical protein